MFKRYLWVILIGFIAVATACGSSSSTTATSDSTTTDTTAPTATVTTYNGAADDVTLTSTAGTDRLSGATSAAFFTLTFSEAMDPTTVVATNITLTCNSSAVTIGTPATSDNITWTIPVETDLAGYVACTLTLVGTGLKDAAGNALGTADSTYAFNTQCTTDDNFAVDTLGFTAADDTEGNCWTYSRTGAPIPSASSTSFAIDTTAGVLTYIAPAGVTLGQNHNLLKEFSAGSFTATLELVGMTLAGGIECDIYALSLTDPTKNAKAAFVSGANCQLTTNNGNTGAATPNCASDALLSQNAPFYLQLIWDGTSISGKYGTSLPPSSTMNAPGGGTTTAVALGSSYQVGIYCEANTAGSFVKMSSFTIDATATAPGTQY